MKKLKVVARVGGLSQGAKAPQERVHPEPQRLTSLSIYTYIYTHIPLSTSTGWSHPGGPQRKTSVTTYKYIYTYIRVNGRAPQTNTSTDNLGGTA